KTMQAYLERDLPMREVTVKKDELMSKLIENKEKHVKDFNEACAGYKEAALSRIEDMAKELKARINRLKEGEMIQLLNLSFNLEVPKSYEKAYDQAITMLKMSVDDKITLRMDEFACYVMDDWD